MSGVIKDHEIVPRVQTVVSAATVTPDAKADDEVVITAQAEALTLANPTGTPYQGQRLILRFKDNGTARAITWDTQYRSVNATLPTTTVISTVVYIVLIYNSTETKWDCILANAASGSSDWELISSASASSSATIDFTGLSSTYHAYVVLITALVPQTDNTILQMRTSTDGGSTYDSGASDYQNVRTILVSTPSTSVDGTIGATQIDLVNNVGNGANEVLGGIINILNPSSATFCQIIYDFCYYSATPNLRHVDGAAMRAAAANVDAIRFLMSSGNIASGEFRLYGLKNA